MIIETKFAPGDKVYCVERNMPYYSPEFVCPVCGGTGIFNDCSCDARFGGMHCRGGKMHRRKVGWSPVESIVREVYVNANSGGEVFVEYELSGMGSYNESAVFLNQLDAQAECDRRILEEQKLMEKPKKLAKDIIDGVLDIAADIKEQIKSL